MQEVGLSQFNCLECMEDTLKLNLEDRTLDCRKCSRKFPLTINSPKPRSNWVVILPLVLYTGVVILSIFVVFARK